MNTGTLSVLLVLSLGLMAGTATGLIIGYASGMHKRDWSAMSHREKTISLGLVLVCSCVCCTALGWYFLVAQVP